MAQEAADPATSVVEHTSIFLLPLSLRLRDQRAVPSIESMATINQALCVGLSRHGWSLGERTPHEATYFHRHVRDVVKERFLEKAIQDPVADRPARVQLFLFGMGVAVLVLEFRGVRPLQDILAFHEHTRYLDRIFQGQELPLPEASPAGAGPEWPWKNKLVHDALAPALTICDEHGFCLDPLEKRMMLLAWVGFKDGTPAELDRNWTPLLYVDKAPGGSFGEDPEFTRALGARHEYRRWWPGTRIGFTRYSAVFVSAPGGRHASWLRSNVQGSYLLLAVVTLAQHCKVLDLKHQAALLVGDLHARRGEVATQWDNLKDGFLLFSTRYWSVELTPHDQGLEMSQQWAGLLGTPQLYQEIREEIERFDATIQARQAQKLNRDVALLTTWTIGIGLVGLWLGFLGTNKPDEALASGAWWRANAGTTVVAMTVTLFVVLYLKKKLRSP